MNFNKERSVRMDAKKLLQQFGLQVSEAPQSIYPYSPVFKIGSVIVKRTQKKHDLTLFLEDLQRRAIAIVAPIAPRQLFEERIFTMYPFVEGRIYNESLEDIQAAGRLLGKIHAASASTNVYSLDVYDVYDFTLEELAEDLATIQQHAVESKREFVLATDILEAAVLRQQELAQQPLPMVASPYDYKAQNLVYTPQPVVIDPDNATFLPRIVDLALVLLLFHNEVSNQPFTEQQWREFMKGYGESITLTASEHEHWQAVVHHLFLDEVLWLMADAAEDWGNDEQYALFVALAKLLQHPYSL